MWKCLVLAMFAVACGEAGPGASSETVAGTTASTGPGAPSSSSSIGATDAPTTTDTGSEGSGGTTTSGVLCTNRTLGAGDYDETATEPFPEGAGGGMRERAFNIHVPASYAPDQPTSVILVFHGFFQKAVRIRIVSEMNAASDAHGFIVVYPQGYDDTWNAGGGCCGFAGTLQAEDTKFIGDILDRLESEFCVDTGRVYAAGYNNGGMFAQRLACELGDRIAAVGSVEGGLAFPGCQPARPIAVMLIDSEVGEAFEPSLPDTDHTWASLDGCGDAAPTTVYEQGAARCDEHQGCDADVAVRLCTVDQGMKPWPGGEGDDAADLDASEELVKFFAAHPLP